MHSLRSRKSPADIYIAARGNSRFLWISPEGSSAPRQNAAPTEVSFGDGRIILIGYYTRARPVIGIHVVRVLDASSVGSRTVFDENSLPVI